MFNKYWRTYPWFLQLILFLLMIFTLSSFATFLILILMPKISGISFNDIINLSPASSNKSIRSGLIAQAFSHAGTFAIPALIFASFTHPRVREYLGIRLPGRLADFLFATGIMVGLIPFFLTGEAWMMQHLHFGKWVDVMQEANNTQIAAFLKLNSSTDLLVLLIVLAVLPAFGEELVFRGVLLRLFHKRVRMNLPVIKVGESHFTPDNQRIMVLPVLLTGFLFALIHFNPYGFVFIFIAGCLLALIYFLTGSILCSMWAHFLYNGIQIGAAFLSQKNESAKIISEGNNIPLLYSLLGLLIFAGSFYLLVRNQTPLPSNWSDDYSEEELPELPKN